MRPHNVRIKHYFIPESHVSAFPGFDSKGTPHGTLASFDIQIEAMQDDPTAKGVQVTVESDDKNSENQPYSYKIVAFGIFTPESSASEEDVTAFNENVQTVAIQVLVGAIREHLASITARGPWQTFILSTLNLTKSDEDKGAEDTTDEAEQ